MTELKYGLAVDYGHDKWQKWRGDRERPVKIPDKARDMEAHRHEKSFTSFVKEHKTPLSARSGKPKTGMRYIVHWMGLGLN
ncbi:MAG: hypothetical protein HRT36_02450 [Alphaproteobacteria bacterium]|nr:hypothetical protein [Alphaproteobacteria bacterium]